MHLAAPAQMQLFNSPAAYFSWVLDVTARHARRANYNLFILINRTFADLKVAGVDESKL
jgi:hypothetical protein